MRSENVASVRARLVWRAWRRWLPARFRMRYEEELIRLHIDRGARGGGADFWWRLLWDAFVTGLALRLDARAVPPDHAASPEFRVGTVPTALRLAVRRLLRQPAFTLGVIVTLALGMGANLTMFSVVDGLLLRPPSGVEAPDDVRRVYVHGRTPFDPGPVYSSSLSYPGYRLLASTTSFTSVAAYSPRELTLGTGAEAERIRTVSATATFFPLLGVSAHRGRLFADGDDVLQPAEPVALLSHAYWQSRFGGTANVIGRTLEIGRGRYTVIGVTSPDFDGIDHQRVDVWLPLHAAGTIESGDAWVDAAGWSWLSVVVRLGDAAAAVAAEEEATSHYLSELAQQRARDPDTRVVLASLISAKGPNPMSEARVGRALFWLAVMVLLISCANVANLLFARGLQRRRQFAVARALGASRACVVGEVVAEAVVLATVAAAASALVARFLAPAAIGVLVPAAPPTLLSLDRTLAFAMLLTLPVILLVSVLPSLRAAGVAPAEAMRERNGSRRTGWLRGSLLLVQALMSVLLLVGAGLFVRSLQRAHTVDFGFATDVLAIELELQDGTRFGARLAPAIRAAHERVRGHPAVQSAAITSLVPFGGWWGLEVDLPGPDSIVSGGDGPFFLVAGENYFTTLGVPVLSGRALTAQDDAPNAPPIAVVNEAMAALAWPGQDPLGRCLIVGSSGDVCTTVVGVAGNHRPTIIDDRARPVFYLAPQHPGIGFVAATALLVRVRGDPNHALQELRDIVRSASPDIRHVTVAPLSARVDPQLRAWRLGAIALTAFGLLALTVAAAGLYAVIAFEVAQRRYELAVRAALGASAAHLAGAVAGRTLSFSLVGVVAGVFVALVAGPRVESLLFDVRAADPGVFAAAVAALVIAGGAALVLPVLRARNTDPGRALRAD